MSKSRFIALAVLAAAVAAPAFAEMSGTLSIPQPVGKAAVRTYNLKDAWPVHAAITDIVFAGAAKNGLPANDGPGRVSFALSDPTYIAAFKRWKRVGKVISKMTLTTSVGGERVSFHLQNSRIINIRTVQPNTLHPQTAGGNNSVGMEELTISHEGIVR